MIYSFKIEKRQFFSLFRKSNARIVNVAGEDEYWATMNAIREYPNHKVEIFDTTNCCGTG